MRGAETVHWDVEGMLSTNHDRRSEHTPKCHVAHALNVLSPSLNRRITYVSSAVLSMQGADHLSNNCLQADALLVATSTILRMA